MNQTIINVALLFGAAGIIALFLLQFSPAKHTLTKAGQVIVNKNLRPTLWSMPIHILSPYGKVLKITSFSFLSISILIMIIGGIYEHM